MDRLANVLADAIKADLDRAVGKYVGLPAERDNLQMLSQEMKEAYGSKIFPKLNLHVTIGEEKADIESIVYVFTDSKGRYVDLGKYIERYMRKMNTPESDMEQIRQARQWVKNRAAKKMRKLEAKLEKVAKDYFGYSVEITYVRADGKGE